MNYLDIFICHKTVLKAFTNMPAAPPVVSVLRGVNLSNKSVCVGEKTPFSRVYSSSSFVTFAFTHSEDILMPQAGHA